MTGLIIGIFIIGITWLIANFTTTEDTRRANAAAQCHATNARFEQAVMNDFLLQGYSFDEAFDKTAEYLMNLDPPLSPCIPKKAYTIFEFAAKFRRDEDFSGRKLKPDKPYTSYVRDPDQYDSHVTQVRRDMLERQGIEPTFDNMRYGIPKTARQLDKFYKRSTYLIERIPVGTRFTHPDFGLCEVVGYEDSVATMSGEYIAKTLPEGRIVRVTIGDKSIRRRVP